MSPLFQTLLYVLFATPALASSVLRRHIIEAVPNTSGFTNATLSLSAGGKAICITGTIPVSATTHISGKLLLSSPASQIEVTELIQEFVQINSTFGARVAGGPATVSDVFNISAKLCYPLDWKKASGSKNIHFLIHGIAFEKSYWDIANGYSYVDAAAEAGYPTFSYDRLGTGLSDHPDPIQIVQSAIQVEIAHSLVKLLRSGELAGQKFQKVIGVGHSYGSIQTLGLTVQYPKDLDAAVLTGFAVPNPAYAALPIVAFNLAIASENSPRFTGLPNAYWVTSTAISDQVTFLRAPNFDPLLFAKIDAGKETVTIGDIITLGQPVAVAANFTGPVDIVNGLNDFIFCAADCSFPVDQSKLALETFYPMRSNGSTSIIIPGIGHGINAHYEAPIAFKQILDFVKRNDL